MGMSEFYGAVDGREAIRTIGRALELGVTLFDTADMYGPFANERLLGRALRRDRDAAVVATKFGFVRGEQGSWLGIDGRPEYVRAACEASLRRLGVDRIDLYYQHCVDRAVPIEETVGAMGELVSRGVVRYLGLSEAPPALVRRAHAVHPISAVQGEYSLLTREPEATVLPVTRELGVGFVAYSPLCRGLLAGGIRSHDDVADDLRGYFPRFQRENLRRNMVLVERAFSIPGVFQHLNHAMDTGDWPILFALTIVGAIIVCAFNLFADLLLMAIDPRVRRPAAAT